MNEIAYLLFSKNTEKALKYASESGQLSNQLDYTKGKAVSLWVTGLATIKSDRQAALAYFQQGISIAESINDQTVICNCLIAIGNVQKSLGEIQKCNESYDRALKLANNIEDKSLALKCYSNMARNYYEGGQYPRAIEFYDRLIRLAEELNDNSSLAAVFNSLASIYYIQANYPVALDLYLKALDINEKLEDRSSQIISYINIAGVKSGQREYDSALKYLHDALKISEEIGDDFNETACLANIGNTYLNMNDPRALEYYERALAKVGDSNLSLLVNIRVNMGIIYTRLDEYDQALTHFTEALLIAEKINLRHPIGEIWAKIGLVYFKQKRYNDALEYSFKSLEVAKELKLLNLQKEVYGQLSDIYASMNNYQAAYQNHILYKTYNDSVFNESNIKEIADLESAYKYDKEKQAYELEAQNRELKIKSQRGIIFFLIVAFLLLLLLGIMIARSYKLKKQLLRIELEEANAELERNQKAMTSATLKLIQTAERDARCIKILENVEKNICPEVRDEVKSLVFDYKSQAYNSNWEEFEILFQKVHASFYTSLNEHFPMLTQNERKLCVFLKLNMSNKQIAQITFQTEEALKKARQRLRKKLEIERDTNLGSFIQNI
ncbi:hypothetical protein MASR1M31_11480 [Porphyromonadaceae bacterium]